MTDTNSDQQFLDEAYELSSPDDMRSFYTKWARQYDEKMQDGLGYLSPQRIADLLTQHHSLFSAEKPERQNRQFEVLDVGCGTGLVGECLRTASFECVDGLDLSSAMIKQASLRACYRDLYQADVNVRLPFEDASYNAVVCAGTFTHGHVDAKPLQELARILKRGGLLVCSIHSDLWDPAGFESGFASLCKQKVLCEVRRELEPYFSGGEKEGYFCVYCRV